MDRTERWGLVAGSLVLLLVSSAVTGAAASTASDSAMPQPATLSGSPAAFAERLAAGHGGGFGSLQTALELILLAAVCAIGVAFYSSVSAGRGGTQVPARLRRR